MGQRDGSTTIPSIFVEYILLWQRHLSFAGARSPKKTNFTIIDQERHKIEQLINIWSPLTTGFIMQTLIYVISMVFLSVMRGLPLWRNVLSGEERRGTAIFAG